MKVSQKTGFKVVDEVAKLTDEAEIRLRRAQMMKIVGRSILQDDVRSRARCVVVVNGCVDEKKDEVQNMRNERDALRWAKVNLTVKSSCQPVT